MEIKARTAASSLFDYYNPEAEVPLAPTDFHVEAGPTPGVKEQLASAN